MIRSLELERFRAEWLQQWGRAPKLDERQGWTLFAEREGLTNEEAEQCWGILSAPARHEQLRVRTTLRQIFGEGQAWAGTGGASFFGGVPSQQGLAPQTQAQVRDQGPQTGPAPGFGFSTRAAERVWMFAKMALLADPLAPPQDIVRQALIQTGISIQEMTPEDIQMLLMAIAATLSELPKPKGRAIGGSPAPVESRQLQEFQGGMSFAGPEPGKLAPSPSYPISVKHAMFGTKPDTRDPKAYKDKGKKKRKALRMLATWLTQRQSPSNFPEEM